MGRLKTRLCRVALCLTLLSQAPAVDARTLFDPLPIFAACTGRLSAVMEFQWLVQDPRSDATQTRRDQMAELLEAVTAPEDRVRAMSLRIEAKVAEAALLRVARFGRDRQVADWAMARAERLVAECQALVIS